MQKDSKRLKWQKNHIKNNFFNIKYLIFPKNVVTLPEIFRKIPEKYIKRLII
jgi:hypothetical protein